MELWLEAEIRIRREDALESARRRRLLGRDAGGRSRTVRIGIANSAQAISDALAAVARSLRNGEAA